jgi:hypothetical protein
MILEIVDKGHEQHEEIGPLYACCIIVYVSTR